MCTQKRFSIILVITRGSPPENSLDASILLMCSLLTFLHLYVLFEVFSVHCARPRYAGAKVTPPFCVANILGDHCFFGLCLPEPCTCCILLP